MAVATITCPHLSTSSPPLSQSVLSSRASSLSSLSALGSFIPHLTTEAIKAHHLRAAIHATPLCSAATLPFSTANLSAKPTKTLHSLSKKNSGSQSDLGIPHFRGHRGLLIRKRSRGSDRKLCIAMAGETLASVKPRKVLFVCLGNICRSPTAEAVFRAAVEKRGLSDDFEIDSAGTIDYHQGDPADGRMMKHAAKRGVKLTSISRPVVRSDFETFDLILAMDENNQRDLNKAFDKWSSQKPLPEEARSIVRLMCSYCRKFDDKEVPDPYYGGSEGFEKVLDLLEDACEGLLDSLIA